MYYIYSLKAIKCNYPTNPAYLLETVDSNENASRLHWFKLRFLTIQTSNIKSSGGGKNDYAGYFPENILEYMIGTQVLVIVYAYFI